MVESANLWKGDNLACFGALDRPGDRTAALAICGAVGFLGRRPLLIVSLGLIVLGCSLEAAQIAVPGRDPSIGDAIANIAGIALGLAATWIGNQLVGASE